jgi:hypothetical protein
MSTIAKPGGYDTAINVIGSLSDHSVISKAIESHFSQSDSFQDLINHRNEFSIRTRKSRRRIEHGVKSAFLQFRSADHEALLQGIFREDVPTRDKELAILWQFALNNRLFREISVNVFAKIYHCGRASISKHDICGYLKEFISLNRDLEISWSESTIDALSTKYLNLLTKLELVSPGRVKNINQIKPSQEAQVLFLYFAKLLECSKANLLHHELLPLLFISDETIVERFKRLSIRGLFHMGFNGIALNIELVHSYRDICDALYHRS